MPNWVVNELKIAGDGADTLLKSLLSKEEDRDDYSFDFNKIIPMPKELDIESGSITATCAEIFISSLINGSHEYYHYKLLYDKIFRYKFNFTEQDIENRIHDLLNRGEQSFLGIPMFRTKEDILEYGKKPFDNYEKYAAKDWFDWCNENWGTKWNACDTIVELNELREPIGNVVTFETAWAPPIKVISKLAELHPEYDFELRYAEEQTGLYTGYRNYHRGETIEECDYESRSKEAYELYFELWGEDDSYVFNEEINTYEYHDNGEEE